MTTMLTRSEVPIAYSMITAAERIRSRRDGGHLYQKYFLFWTAFDSIYTAIARREGCISQIKRDEEGSVVTRPNGVYRSLKWKSSVITSGFGLL